MNSADKALAELLGVGTDTINGLADLMGGNGTEIYNTLVKEYILYTVMENILTFAMVTLFVLIVPAIILLFSYVEFPDNIKYKRVFKVCCIVMITLIFAVLITNILSSMLAPNIHIIKEIGH